jgi:hypothetical protein
MSASTAVHGLFRISRAIPPIRRAKSVQEPAPQSHARSDAIKCVLQQSGGSITQLSDATRRRYGAASPYFIPPTFLYKLRSGVTPHLCQMVSLSEYTGYRFADCLSLCGFDLRQIPRLQMRLHNQRTVLITPLEDCFESFRPLVFSAGDFSRGSFAFGKSIDWGCSRRYRFAKIGAADARACATLLAGSIVRVDRFYTNPFRCHDRFHTGVSIDSLLWLVEHPDGLTCSQVRWIDDRHIVLLPSREPWGCWPLRLHSEARILGLLDTDVHLVRSMHAGFKAGTEKPEHERPWTYDATKLKLPDLLQASRRRAGLTFRTAHRLTRSVAQILGDREYAVALGLLSDYETMHRLPRHIAKILSLCVAYCMDFRELLNAAGVFIDDSGQSPIPQSEIVPSIPVNLFARAGHRNAIKAYARSAVG